jgi:hypothetical protein
MFSKKSFEMSDFLEKIKYFMLQSTGIKAAAWVGVVNVMIRGVTVQL